MSARCGASRRCRQPVAFRVTSGSWTSFVCLNHLGTLCLRRLTPSTRHLLVEPVEVVQ